MDIYLPIAEVSLNVFILLGVGGSVGLISGAFGVGGGFLMIPLLIFVGVPPPIAAASSANQVVGASLSGVLGHWRRGNVDFKIGAIMLCGGLVGSAIGVWLFGLLRRIGQIEVAISLCFIVLLGTLGVLMTIESARVLLQQRRRRHGEAGGAVRRRLHQHTWLHGLPLKTRFRQSRLYISALLPAGLGFGVGVLSGLLGIGGGFLLVPAMIYLLGLPTRMVPGTSLLQVFFITASVTLLQAYNNHTVDVVLALLLLLGGAVGAQIGARIASRLRGEQLRFLLALLLLAVAAKLAFDLTVRPTELYTIVMPVG